MLIANRVTVSSGKKLLINNVNLDIPPGQLTAIVGPNGAGKSTLLKCLSGELNPDRGQVHMNQRDLSQWSLAERARQRAVMPQQSTLSFPFQVNQVVLMGRSPHTTKNSASVDNEVVDQVLSAIGIRHLRNRHFTALSGGEQQLVQLARVLAQLWLSDNNQPCYILMDEPTSALDLGRQHSVLNQVLQFANQQGVGVAMVLHDLNLACVYADQIAILQQGQLMSVGAPAEVITRNLLESVYGLAVTIERHPLHRHRPLVITGKQQNPYQVVDRTARLDSNENHSYLNSFSRSLKLGEASPNG